MAKHIFVTGGMDPLTYGGCFTLERVLGTVPAGGALPPPAAPGALRIWYTENLSKIRRRPP